MENLLNLLRRKKRGREEDPDVLRRLELVTAPQKPDTLPLKPKTPPIKSETPQPLILDEDDRLRIASAHAKIVRSTALPKPPRIR